MRGVSVYQGTRLETRRQQVRYVKSVEAIGYLRLDEYTEKCNSVVAVRLMRIRFRGKFRLRGASPERSASWFTHSKRVILAVAQRVDDLVQDCDHRLQTNRQKTLDRSGSQEKHSCKSSIGKSETRAM
jgi:hypothetical protein